MTSGSRADMRRTLVVLTLLALLCWSAVGCKLASSLGWLPRPTVTFTITPTPLPTATPTATATPTPTLTPTPTAEPLRLTVSLRPPQVRQGHTLLIELQANRAITVAGVFDARQLAFAPQPSAAWALVGVPVQAEAGEHPLQVSIVDSKGSNISTTFAVTVLPVEFGAEDIHVPLDRMSLLNPGVVMADAQVLDQAFSARTPQQYWNGAFLQPVAGPLTSAFGMWRTYNDGRNGYHTGVDIGSDEGAPVAAANAGKVVLATALQVHGNTVIVDHGWGVFTAYYHLSQTVVSAGQQVAQGETLGLVGNTGLSTGAHLHWDVRVGGVPVNPLEWLSRTLPE